VIQLADSEDTLTLFTEGLAGRYFHVKAISEFNPLRLEIDDGNGAATQDTIYLPEQIEYPDSAGYRVLAMEQLGYREFGSYQFRIDIALQRIPGLAQLTPAQQITRESDLATFYRHVEHPGLLKRLHASCEKVRMLACLKQRYPGFHRHQQPFARYRHRDLHSLVGDELTGLLMTLEAFADGIVDDIALDSGLLELFQTASSSIAQHCGLNADIYDAAATAFELYQLIAPHIVLLEASGELDSADVSVEDWMQREDRLEDWKEALADIDSRIEIEFAPGTELEADNTDGLSEGDLRQEDVDLRVLKNERDNLSRKLEMEKSAIKDALGAARPAARSYRYDEWDYTRRSYLRHWCRLFEEPLAGNPDGSDLQALKQVIKRHAPGVLKRFEQIKPLGFQRISRVADGDEIDLNALIQARQDVRAGKTPDERVYSRKERVHRDVCAAFLVDLSASTDDPVEPPEPVVHELEGDRLFNMRDPYDDDLDLDAEAEEPVRRIIDVQRESMAVMATALEHLGDSYGIYGFSGYGRDCVEFFVAKEPDQAFTPATLSAIAGMTPKRSTRMGPAIRHATNKLTGSGHAMKLLIILSDGFPQDCDYGPERGDHQYGLMDTAKSLEEAHNKGVETFCVTVDKSGHDYLKQMCPDSRYLIIDEIEDLPEALSKVYQTLAGR
jgi:hypothetical protein